jgi:hypothetical protein
MKLFIFKILKYLALLGTLIFFYLMLIIIRPDLVDAFYYRFTTPKAPSMILGGSRAAQAIKPGIINELICTDENKIINHAFALGVSSYGPNYLREITKKLDKTSNNGLFIISAVPWSLSIESDFVDDSTTFFEVENNLFVGNLKSSDSNPNFDYLLNHWVNKFEPFVRIFKYMINYQGMSVLHKDGWLEITTRTDSAYITERVRESSEEYMEKRFKLSSIRLDYLEKIIRYLDKYGEVVLIRMPVSKQMQEIEDLRFPEFDNIIQQIANKNSIHYFNFFNMSGQFLTIDTHHLYKKDGERFTYILCDSLMNYYQSNSGKFKIAEYSGI